MVPLARLQARGFKLSALESPCSSSRLPALRSHLPSQSLRLLLAILASVAAAYALSLYLTVPANPEVNFWREVMVRRDTEIAAVRQAKPGTPIIFFTGGSSTAFSIDPLIIEQSCHRPAFNLGLPAAAGGPYLLHQAFKRTRPGDILVVCLEADLLAYGGELDPTPLAFSLSLLDHDPIGAAGGSTFGKGLAPRDLLNLPRPGSRYLATLAARIVTGKDYRYTPADIRYRGRIETPVSNPTIAPLREAGTRHLHPDGAALLKQLAAAAKQRGVTLFYSMPWRWTHPEFSDAWRSANLPLLTEINAIIPVLDDATRGVGTHRDHFSDSVQHLTSTGSTARTTALAGALRAMLNVERGVSTSEL
jgi:hypothetical protein